MFLKILSHISSTNMKILHLQILFEFHSKLNKTPPSIVNSCLKYFVI